jgi:hypothetical protein
MMSFLGGAGTSRTMGGTPASVGLWEGGTYSGENLPSQLTIKSQRHRFLLVKPRLGSLDDSLRILKVLEVPVRRRFESLPRA